MKVRELMTRNVWSCEADDDLATVGKIMSRVGCGAMPVRGENDRLVGFLTDRDVCVYLAEGNRRPSEVHALDVMHRQVWTCGPGDDVTSALEQMRRHQVRRLPVVEAGGRLEGILSLDDIAAAAHGVIADRFDGPIYADVARTLQAVSHALRRDEQSA
jgi:CBS domain-containing protein